MEKFHLERCEPCRALQPLSEGGCSTLVDRTPKSRKKLMSSKTPLRHLVMIYSLVSRAMNLELASLCCPLTSKCHLPLPRPFDCPENVSWGKNPAKSLCLSIQNVLLEQALIQLAQEARWSYCGHRCPRRTFMAMMKRPDNSPIWNTHLYHKYIFSNKSAGFPHAGQTAPPSGLLQMLQTTGLILFYITGYR